MGQPGDYPPLWQAMGALITLAVLGVAAVVLVGFLGWWVVR